MPIWFDKHGNKYAEDKKSNWLRAYSDKLFRQLSESLLSHSRGTEGRHTGDMIDYTEAKTVAQALSETDAGIAELKSVDSTLKNNIKEMEADIQTADFTESDIRRQNDALLQLSVAEQSEETDRLFIDSGLAEELSETATLKVEKSTPFSIDCLDENGEPAKDFAHTKSIIPIEPRLDGVSGTIRLNKRGLTVDDNYTVCYDANCDYSKKPYNRIYLCCYGKLGDALPRIRKITAEPAYDFSTYGRKSFVDYKKDTFELVLGYAYEEGGAIKFKESYERDIEHEIEAKNLVIHPVITKEYVDNRASSYGLYANNPAGITPGEFPVACPGFELKTGARIVITFAYGVSAATMKLNVNNTGSKDVYFPGLNAMSTARSGKAFAESGSVGEFVYDGSCFKIIGMEIPNSKLTLTLNGIESTYNGDSFTTKSWYAPTAAGTKGQVLISNGSGAPVWVSKTIIIKTQAEFESMLKKTDWGGAETVYIDSEAGVYTDTFTVPENVKNIIGVGRTVSGKRTYANISGKSTSLSLSGHRLCRISNISANSICNFNEVVNCSASQNIQSCNFVIFSTAASGVTDCGIVLPKA